jgi:hypothetical protein
VVTATLESARDARTSAHAFLASGEDAQAAVFCGAAAAQRDLLGALAHTTQRRALAEIQSRLLASLTIFNCGSY